MPSLVRDLPRPLRIDSNQRGTHRGSVRGVATPATAGRQSTRAHICSKWQTTACLNERHRKLDPSLCAGNDRSILLDVICITFDSCTLDTYYTTLVI